MKVLLFGTFDNLHRGHRFILEEAQKRGNVRVIVARDANVQKIKGYSPEQSEEERRAAIENAYPSIEAILGHEWDFLQPVLEYEPDLILLGYDQKLPPGLMAGDLPAQVEYIAAFEPEIYKSSRLRKPKA
jgi:FAD synthetase